MKNAVDAAHCTGHARCNASEPELYPLDDDGQCSITELTIALGQEQSARAGAAACPERAISVSDA